MNGKDLFSGMSFVEERLVNEAETERPASGRFAWKRWAAIVVLAAALAGQQYMLLKARIDWKK